MTVADTKLATVVAYYDGCSAGDAGAMERRLAPDVVHWFLAPNPGSAPVRGAAALAAFWAKVQARFDANWTVDHLLESGDEAVIEWSMFWTPAPGAARVAVRGAEWYRFAADGRIAEIRAYYQQRPDASCELEGFPYGRRGFSSVGQETSALHSASRTAR